MTKLLQRLELRNLAVRRTDTIAEDGRAVEVVLTPEGEEMVRNLLNAARGPVNRLVDGLIAIRDGS